MILAAGPRSHGLVRSLRWAPALFPNVPRPRAGMARVRRRRAGDSARRARGPLLAVRPGPGGTAPADPDAVGRHQLLVRPLGTRRGVRALPRRVDGARVRAGAAAIE